MNRLWTIVAILACMFPFVALGYKIFENSATSGVIYTIMALIFFGSLLIASRASITLSPSEAVASPERAPRPPAPPITWSWDGVDRQPEGEYTQDDGGTIEG